MSDWLRTDWSRLFVPEMSLPEVLVRGTLVYVGVVLLLRVILKRQAGKVALSDLLVVAVVAGICRNPLVRDAYSVTDGLLVIVVVLFWSFAMDWLSYYVPLIHKILHPKPVPLIRDGVVLEGNLKHELVTDSQLHCQLRRNGVKDVRQVEEAWMEGDGQVSVLRKAKGGEANEPASTNGAAEFRAQRFPPPAAENGRVREVAGEPEVRDLLRAAEKLQEKLAWHRERAAAYQRTITEVKRLLGSHAPRREHTNGVSEPRTEPGERPT